MSGSEDFQQSREEDNLALGEAGYSPSASSEEMAAVSKEPNPEAAEGPKSSSASDGIVSLMYAVVKKVAVVGAIYYIGYMGWSIAWLITPIILSVAREQWRKSTEQKRSVAKAFAMACEKDVILARIDELPAWVYFPDIERCEWVNKIFHQVWPNANHYARDLLKNSIEPNVATALANYKLNGFKFDRIILGTIPPRIGGVKIYDKYVSRNEIIMDLDLFYVSDCDINFFVSGMKGGLKDFQIHGMVRVIMKPLIRSMPLVGGLQVFFLNNPNVDFNLVGIVDVLDMPGLADIFRRVIVEQIAAIMVLPNKLPISLNNEVPAIDLKMPEPEGVLRIHVIEAKDLMKKDISVLGKGKSDPYTVITVGAQEFKTKVIDNTVNPKWDYWCEAVIFAESGQILELMLFDRDDASNDENLGRASVEISNVVKKGLIDTWLLLEEAKHGMLHVRLTWYKLSTDVTDLSAALEETQLLRVPSMSTALLSVFIDSAKNLPQARIQSKPDPYLILSVGKQIEQTPVILRTDSPVWEQGFSFLVSNPENDTIQLKIVDQKTGNEIGRYTYILSALLDKKNLEVVSQPFQLQKSGPESKIIMSLSLRILQRGEVIEDDVSVDETQSEFSTFSLISSVNTSALSETQFNPATNKDQQSNNFDASNIEGVITKTVSGKLSPTPQPSSSLMQGVGSNLRHRSPDVTSCVGEYGLGRIQLTLRYIVQRQRLTVTVHKIMNIPLNDPTNIPDPYVKLYLLPGRSRESKRKTQVIKDNCNPVYESTFEYVISSSDMHITELEVTVCSQKGFLYGGSPIIGMLKIPLSNPEISTSGFTSWYDLQPEMKHD